MSEAAAITRRGFVVLAAGAAGGLTLGAVPSMAAADPSMPLLAQPFLRIARNNTVTVLAKHLDMGQGVWSGLAAIVAEELDAGWSQMRVEGAPANQALYKHTVWGFQTTGGSTSMSNSWEQLRRAGATARRMLVLACAERWSVPADEVRVVGGVLSHRSGRRATFGAMAERASALPVPAEVTLKDPAAFRLLRGPLPRLDAVAKSHGMPVYAIDVERPGMKVAVVLRAPRFGAVLREVDDRAARAVPGVVEVLKLPSGVAVVGEHTWAAMQGRRALQVAWDESAAEKRSSDALMNDFKRLAAGDEGVVALQRGDAQAALASAAQVVEAEFELPYLAHAPMEPLCAVGEWRDGRCELWAGSQNQTADAAAVARILQIPLDRVVLNTIYAGGSFGRRATFAADWISELAHLLKASGGAWPVKLMWTREDDLRGGYYRPMVLHRVRAGLGADGRLLAIDQTIVAQSFLYGPPKPGVAQRADPTATEGHVASRYDVAHATVRWINPVAGVPVQMYRALSFNHTTFVKEVLADELARRAGRDALEWRLAHLATQPRQAAVLRLAAAKAGWGAPLPAGRALGLAVQQANDGTFIAQVAQVRIEQDALTVERVVCAVDCGIALNSDNIRAQIEGGIAFGLGGALHGRITLAEGRVEQSNFHDFPQLRLTEMPRVIDVHFIDGGTAPTGIGEPGSVLIAAAVANAVARLTGRPMRRLPLELQAA